MAKCPSISRKGESCRGIVPAGATYCHAHDPRYVEQRKRAAAVGGAFKSKGLAEYKAVKAQLRQLADDVLEGEINRADAAVVAQVLGAWCKVCEAEVKLRSFQEIDLVEFHEMRGRIEAIEQDQYERKGATNGWPA